MWPERHVRKWLLPAQSQHITELKLVVIKIQAFSLLTEATAAARPILLPPAGRVLAAMDSGGGAAPAADESRRRSSADCVYYLASPLTCSKVPSSPIQILHPLLLPWDG